MTIRRTPPTPPPHGSPFTPNRVTIEDADIAAALKDSTALGRNFAFILPDLGANPVVMTIAQLLGATPNTPGQVLPLWGDEAVHVLGAIVAGSTVPPWSMEAISPDRDLYRAGKDQVTLLVLMPGRPTTDAVLVILQNNEDYNRLPITTDAHGLCQVRLGVLDEGHYAASIEDSQAEPVEFEVAEYRLAPLVASWVEQQATEDRLVFTVRLEQLGEPFRGNVHVELFENNRRTGKVTGFTTDASGVGRGIIRLAGAGPFVLHFIAGENTATLPLRGSSQVERQRFTCSRLGQVWDMSLLPLPGSMEERGLFFAPAGTEDTPFSLEKVITARAVLQARVEAGPVVVSVINPLTREVHHERWEHVTPGQRLEVETPAPFGTIAVGAIIGSRAWEGQVLAIRPSDLKLDIKTPATAKPGEHITINLKTNRQEPVPVRLVVRDARLIVSRDPRTGLAAAVKRGMEQYAGPAANPAWVEKRVLDEAMPPVYNYPFAPPSPMPMMMPASIMDATAMAPGRTLMPLMARATSAFMAAPMAAQAAPAGGGLSLAESAAPEAVTQSAPLRMRFPDLLYSDIVMVTGQAEVRVRLGESIAAYGVEAIALDGLDWRWAETSIQTKQDVICELSVAPFVLPGDTATGRLLVSSASGRAVPRLTCDDQPAVLFVNGKPLPPNAEISGGPTTLTFVLHPGDWVAAVTDPVSGQSDATERIVDIPGKRRLTVQSFRLLQEGQEVDRQTLNAEKITILPGLDTTFDLVVDATTDYSHRCCEQTAAKLLAGLAGLVGGRNGDLEPVILTGVKREEAMWLPGKGFRMYPKAELWSGAGDGPDQHYGPMAARYLWLIGLSVGQQPGDWLSTRVRKALTKAGEMGADTAHAYGLDKIRRVETTADAYVVVKSGQGDVPAAVEFARKQFASSPQKGWIAAGRAMAPWFGGYVGGNMETAYGAATLLAAGGTADYPTALLAANALLDRLNAQGMLYSTADSAAVIALLMELRRLGLVGGAAEVEVNGRVMSLKEAAALLDPVETVRCRRGVAPIRVLRHEDEDWEKLAPTMPAQAQLLRDGRPVTQLRAGQMVDLVVTASQPAPGLLAHVTLPDVLVRLVGGGQEQRFTVDFSGGPQVTIPLLATASTQLPGERRPGTQHAIVLIRNMFKMEDVAKPASVEVRVG